MIGPVQQLPASATPVDLAALYRDPLSNPDELVAGDLVDEMCLTVSPTLAVPTRMALGHAVVVDHYVYRRYVRSLEGECSHE